MTVFEMKNLVMHQTGNDADDLGDYEPFIMAYLNTGYDKLVEAWAGNGVHVMAGGEYPPLERGRDVPNLPPWCHQGIADWATWLIYRNGNPSKQNRGYAFRSSAEDMTARVAASGGRDGRAEHFKNIPR